MNKLDSFTSAADAMQQASMHEEHALDNQAMIIDHDISRRAWNSKLSTLRAQIPGIAISMLPNTTTTVLLTANVPQDIQVCAGRKLAKFSSDQVIFLSRNGNCSVPTGTVNTDSGSFIPDKQQYYYVDELQALSVVSPVAAYVTVEWFTQL